MAPADLSPIGAVAPITKLVTNPKREHVQTKGVKPCTLGQAA